MRSVIIAEDFAISLRQPDVAELNDQGVAAYRKKDYREAERILLAALDKADKENQERLEILNNLWVN
ncbi:MAG: hypothetical protein R3C24_13685 [Cyanobacteriota/Melainabacteria group bacterium]|nr:hypothetical protein [Cyanobacteria bacterium HKST-UBA01]MCB9466668.1 hypothetical protein [Candidatus Obscuribacterales bacterium]